MPIFPEQPLLDSLMDSWDRGNTILLNLLRAIPEHALEVSPMKGSRTIARLFTHINYGRRVFVL